ncbi:MAG: hypothetical protein HOJ15_02100 [Candidatus Jacksonbacteria bacterium]|jgi:hypothetical protein|nr:hypothetical protein [Candidatus Jacksonbacteria bacterium]MBT6034759.1 hypothetical protein [Candidatus Jacksonbacteria bacterium]MBT6301197.1 hypothetical protein [Candidatus Jacksonbacteria bacterium]MBT6757056.1 hypothetical protein [Candidatus Jacksonbacteria bacterium]MBT6954800.1 hypothetical protein [Candidatus Jacksonbacteria bacterium]
MKSKNISIIVWAAAIVMALVVSRILPHPWNFTPIGAAAFWGAFVFRKWWVGGAVLIAAMLLSDAFIGFYQWQIFVAVYGSFALYAVYGKLAAKYSSSLSQWGTALFGSLSFFVITNASVWLFGTLYPKTFDGLIASLVAGIPFYRNMLFGDVVYIAVPLVVFAVVRAAQKDELVKSVV